MASDKLFSKTFVLKPFPKCQSCILSQNCGGSSRVGGKEDSISAASLTQCLRTLFCI